MDQGALEGHTRGDYFLDYIFAPSVNQCTVHCKSQTAPIGNQSLNQVAMVVTEIQSAVLKSNGLVERILGKQSVGRYLNFSQFVSQLTRMDGRLAGTL